MKLDIERALFLAPHIDDIEFGCGGTISKLLAQGAEIIYVAFSDCKESVETSLPSDILRIELKKSAGVFGLDLNNVKVLDFSVRYFQERRQEILQNLIELKNDFKPDAVFTPSRSDIHQDHKVVTEECIRAFKHTSIFGYELPWNCLSFSYDTFITLNDIDLQNKIDAISCYQSQNQRIYSNAEYVKAMALTRGLKINTKYAEVFELIRLIID